MRAAVIGTEGPFAGIEYVEIRSPREAERFLAEG